MIISKVLSVIKGELENIMMWWREASTKKKTGMISGIFIIVLIVLSFIAFLIFYDRKVLKRTK